MGPDVTATCGDYYKSVSLCLCGPLETTTYSRSFLRFLGRNKSSNQIANVQHCSLRTVGISVGSSETFLSCFQYPRSVPNDHRGPLMSSWFGPERYHAPWQSSGPNELISQLETLDGRREATRGRMGWNRKCRWRKRWKSRTGFMILLPQGAEMTSKEGTSTREPIVPCIPTFSYRVTETCPS